MRNYKQEETRVNNEEENDPIYDVSIIGPTEESSVTYYILIDQLGWIRTSHTASFGAYMRLFVEHDGDDSLYDRYGQIMVIRGGTIDVKKDRIIAIRRLEK